MRPRPSRHSHGDALPGGEHVSSTADLLHAFYEDLNEDGLANQGDRVTVSFSHDVFTRGAPPVDEVFELEPPGSFGAGAFFGTGGRATEVIIHLGRGSTLQPNGPHGATPGSSGISVKPAQSRLMTHPGFPVRAGTTYLDIQGELAPRIVEVRFLDANGDCTVDFRDSLEITFSTNVSVRTEDPSEAFQLHVTGDSLGLGPTFLGGGRPTDVATLKIGIGTSPVLRIVGAYDSTARAPGSPSGLDVRLAPGVVVDADFAWLDALPRTSPGVDVAFQHKPLWDSPGRSREGAEFGTSVAPAGDVNNDGFGDVIVGAPRYSDPAVMSGEAYVYLGMSGGLSTRPSWTSTGDALPYARYGASVASPGDVNGDGFSDIIVGAPDAEPSGTGKAYLYLGGPGGPSPQPAWESSGRGAPFAGFGAAVASAGDVNQDGFSDFLVGAPGYGLGRGIAFLYLGSPLPLATDSTWSAQGRLGSGDGFGSSLAGAGDVNRDGYPDVLIGAPDADGTRSMAGAAYLYLGGGPGLPGGSAWKSSGEDVAGAAFGRSLSGAGDVNGDGFADVIVGAPGRGNSSSVIGEAFLYLGDASGLGRSAVSSFSGAPFEGSEFGISVAPAGDVNLDGLADVIVGASGYRSEVPSFFGAAFVYLGSPGGLEPLPGWKSTGNSAAPQRFGAAVASAGDVNGDGLPEVIVGAPWKGAQLAWKWGRASVFCIGH